MTQNEYADTRPGISGDLIAWESLPVMEILIEHKSVIHFSDGAETTRLPESLYDAENVRVAGNRIVWQAETALGRQVFLATVQ